MRHHACMNHVDCGTNLGSKPSSLFSRMPSTNDRRHAMPVAGGNKTRIYRNRTTWPQQGLEANIDCRPLSRVWQHYSALVCNNAGHNCRGICRCHSNATWLGLGAKPPRLVLSSRSFGESECECLGSKPRQRLGSKPSHCLG